MANYQLSWDTGTKIVTVKVTGFVPDAEAELMAADLLRIANEARRKSGVLRVLFDNGDGAVFSPKAAEAFGVLKTIRRPEDRYAVLVAGNLNRMQADRSRSDNAHVFDSEADAIAWLKEGT